MSWILASILMIIGSIIFYLSVRVAKSRGIGVSDQYLGQFVFSGLINLIFILVLGINVNLSLENILLIFAVALILSWGSNIASLKSLELAPNPGYPLIISKSYVIMTSIFAVLFMGKSLTVVKFIAIGFVVLFAYFIGVDKSKTKSLDKNAKEAKWYNNWLILSIITFFGFGFLSLAETSLVDIGIKTFVLIFYYRIALVTAEVLKRLFWGPRLTIKVKFNKALVIKLFILLGIGAGQFLFNYFMKEGYRTAPNPGYVSAANTASIAIITALAALIFHDHLNKRKILGMIGIITCLAVIYI